MATTVMRAPVPRHEVSAARWMRAVVAVAITQSDKNYQMKKYSTRHHVHEGKSDLGLEKVT